MRRIVILAVVAALGLRVAAEGTFNVVIETSTESEKFAFHLDDAVDFTVDWGNGGGVESVSSGLVTHVYEEPGEYTVKLAGGASRVAFGRGDATPTLVRDVTSKVSDGITGITSAKDMFYEANQITSFTQADWFDDVIVNVESCHAMFYKASNFNHDISGWDMSNVKNTREMFYTCKAFNADITGWDMSSVVNMGAMIYNMASSWNQDISGWDVSSVEDMSYMLSRCVGFTHDLSSWDMSSVTAIQYMFRGCTKFNGDISTWDLNNVRTINHMLSEADVFNSDVSNWKFPNVTSLREVFGNAKAFDQDIGEWDVSNITNMRDFLKGAQSFNQDIGGWDVSNVEDMSGMLSGAVSFNQDISGWNVSNVTTFDEFLTGATLSTDYYNELWRYWSRLPLQEDVVFHGGLSQYDTGVPESCRQYVIDTFNWSVTDGGSSGKPYAAPGTVIILM